MRNLFVAVGLLVGLIAWPHNAAAAEKSCVAEKTITATIEQVQVDLDRFRGRCVRLKGILAGGRLYADRRAPFDQEIRTEDHRRPRRSIVVLRTGSRTPAYVELTGRINDCGCANDAIQSYSAAHPGDIVMLSGYCHTSMETYLDRPAIRVLSRTPVARLLEADVTADRRLLTPGSVAMPGSDQAAVAGKALLAAIAARNEAEFRRLHNPLAQDILDTDPPIEARTNDWVKEAHRDFANSAKLQPTAAAILAKPDAQTRVFVDSSELANFRKGGDKPYRVFTCWCTANDCSGRWPIAPDQADNLPGRPYFCLIVNDYLVGPGKKTVPEVELPDRTTGFAEPQ